MKGMRASEIIEALQRGEVAIKKGGEIITIKPPVYGSVKVNYQNETVTTYEVNSAHK